MYSASVSTVASAKSKKSSKTGAIVGGVIGGVVGIALCALIAGLIVARRRNRAKKINEQDQSTNPGYETALTTEVALQTFPSLSESSLPSYNASNWDVQYSSLKIGKELGRGAFGVVYKAKWRNTDCVVKQLDINRKDDNSISLFLKEANNAKNLRNHPNVCTMLGVCTDVQFPICIVMEFVPLGSLWGMITEKKIIMDANTVLEFAKDVASGMGHLHQENILHCDLACRNLLVAYKNQTSYMLKIADFGLSRHVLEADLYVASNNSTFPIRWTAPETLTQRQISRASDVWSYAVTLWEMSEGRIPYFGKVNAEVIDAVCNQNYKLPPPTQISLSPALYTIMLMCLASNPKERPTFEEISKLLDDLTEEASTDRTLEQSSALYGNSQLYNTT